MASWGGQYTLVHEGPFFPPHALVWRWRVGLGPLLAPPAFIRLTSLFRIACHKQAPQACQRKSYQSATMAPEEVESIEDNQQVWGCLPQHTPHSLTRPTFGFLQHWYERACSPHSEWGAKGSRCHYCSRAGEAPFNPKPKAAFGCLSHHYV